MGRRDNTQTGAAGPLTTMSHGEYKRYPQGGRSKSRTTIQGKSWDWDEAVVVMEEKDFLSSPSPTDSGGVSWAIGSNKTSGGWNFIPKRLTQKNLPKKSSYSFESELRASS